MRERRYREKVKPETALGQPSERSFEPGRQEEMGRQRRRSWPIDYKVPESRSGKIFEESADGARVGNIVRDHLASLLDNFEEQYISLMRN